ncbi:hypothetical protein PBAT_02065 [Paenibacillus antarcticus]|uniref:HTH araC/xylS-type domain-containing protein n=2 Tax=Paenibacillus antarcticus TaxID=253703 RepID=A0A168R0Q1_9BACL|nr:hypothetical protein PBAT_02065 [Paenibacillus antarcticus]
MQEDLLEFSDTWHNIPTSIEKLGGIWLVRAGRNVAKPNYEVGPKQIEHYGLHFIVSGRIRLEYEGEAVDLQKGDLFCLMPNLTYRYYVLSVERLKMIWLTLNGPQTPLLLAGCGLSKAKPYSRNHMDLAVRSMLNKIEDSLWERKVHVLSRNSMLLKLFVLLECEVGGGGDLNYGHKENWVNEAVEFFQFHYTEQLSIERVARMIGVHRSHFTLTFTQRIGMSPQQYVQRLRMDRAKKLLYDQSLMVSEISLTVGYPDLYSFSRAFKKHTGCSPSEYRLNVNGCGTGEPVDLNDLAN